MPTFIPTDSDFDTIGSKGRKKHVLKKDAFNAFNSSLLGLGELKKESSSTDAIAAIFDLQGFTNFCKQIEPHLSVPLFLSEFLGWLMEALKLEMKRHTYKKGILLWSPLPFLVKFMGDGLLVLWDVSSVEAVKRRNIVVSASIICDNYEKEFLPTIRSKVVEPPPKLRCGLARGTVFSVGDGNDYVGSCINMAARLQKMPGVTFAFNRRGFEFENVSADGFFGGDIIIKQVSIRGIGENELVGILKSEFKSMKAYDRKRYRKV